MAKAFRKVSVHQSAPNSSPAVVAVQKAQPITSFSMPENLQPVEQHLKSCTRRLPYIVVRMHIAWLVFGTTCGKLTKT